MKSYEVEIKSLLGDKVAADNLKARLKKKYTKISLVGHGKQLNHYFNIPDDLAKFEKQVIAIIPEDKKTTFADVIKHGKKISVRTRDADGKVLFIMKASVGDDTSSNGVKRVEFEVPVSMSLDKIDRFLLDTGCTYQAKWSREREEYSYDDFHICIDKNAGYGYLAEFEKVTTDEGTLDETKKELTDIMKSLNVEELPQDRLERMFAYYNANWRNYYGTDKTFNIK